MPHSPLLLQLVLILGTARLLSLVMTRIGQPPVIGAAASPADPLPQALVLTAIVIGFAMTAFLIVLSLRARAELGNDHVDGRDEA